MAATLGNIDITPYCAEGKTFAVVCEREGEHEFSSQDIAAEVGERIGAASGRTVNLRSPDTVLFVHIQDTHCVAGIDIAGCDLSKRHWKIFAQSQLRPTVARGMLAWAEYANGKVLLDPFCRDGAFGIEAYCVATGRSPHVYQKAAFAFHQQFEKKLTEWDGMEQPLKEKIVCSALQFGEVKSAEKNAKIAGIDRQITFRRIENDWLDMKFEPNSVDCVVSLFPQPGARHPPKVLERTYRDTLKLLVDILRKNGRFCTLSNPLLEGIAEEVGFKLLETHEVWQGKLMLTVGVWGKA